MKFTMIDDSNLEYFLPLLPRRAAVKEIMSGVISDVLPLLGNNGAISFVAGDSNTDKLLRQILGEDVLSTRNAIHAGILL